MAAPQRDKTAFLDRLIAKLSVGNRKSIHLKSIPGDRMRRFDAADLRFLGPQLDDRFLEKLLGTERFSLLLKIPEADKIRPAYAQKLRKRLDSLVNENRDNELEFGTRPFGFGFPLLIKKDARDPTKTIEAPLFIWSFDIEKRLGFTDQWKISRNEDKFFGLNPVLKNHIRMDEGYDLAPLNPEILENAFITESELLHYCDTFLKSLGLKEGVPKTVLVPSPEPHLLKQVMPEKALIRWSGVFGIFKSPKESIIRDLLYMRDHQEQFLFERNPVHFQPRVNLSSVKTDPSQSRVLSQLSKTPRQIIQGPPGTGKSQCLSAIIAQALHNGKKVLVVGEKRTALDVIHQNLSKQGFGQLSVTIEDVYRDRKKVVNSVRERVEDLKKPFEEFTNDLDLEAHLFTQMDLLERYLAEAGSQKFDEKNRVELGIDLMRLRDLTILDFPEAQDIFKYSSQDFSFWLKTVREAEIRCESMEFFDPLWNELEIPPKALLDLTKTQANYLKAFNAYRTSYENWYEQLLVRQRNWQGEIEEFIIEKSEEWEARITQMEDALKSLEVEKVDHLKRVLWHLGSVFQKKFKDRVALVKSIDSGFDYLNGEWEMHPFFPETEVPKSRKFSPLQRQEYLKELSNSLEKNKNQSRKVAIAFAEKGLGMEELQIKPMALRDWVLQRPESPECLFFSDSIRSRISNYETPKTGATTHGHQNGILDRFESELHKLYPILEWKAHLQSLPQSTASLLRQLSMVKNQSWREVFKRLYFQKYFAGQNIVEENFSLPAMILEQRAALRKQLAQEIFREWQKRQITSIESFEKLGYSVKRLYNKRGRKGQTRNSLRKILETRFELFSDFFPVLLVNPSTCASITPLREGLFDLVLFDEASQLRIEDTFPALNRGKLQIVAGDSQQMPPSSYFSSAALDLDGDEVENWLEDDLDLAEKESLLDYAEDNNFHSTLLEFHYRSRNPQLIEFSNWAFYKSELKPIPTNQEEPAFLFFPINGCYDQKFRVNEKEAEAVVKGLLDLGKQNPIPSIGVATFNVMQRDLILDKIYNRMEENEESMSAFSRLFEKGLFVKNLENIQGDERDVMLLSTTFGPQKDGNFMQRFGPINQTHGYRLLNVLISRAKSQVQVFSSIPDSFIQSFLGEERSSKNLFYAYLSYARSCAENNIQTVALVKDWLQNSQQNQSVTFGKEALSAIFRQLKPQAYRIEVPFSWGGLPFHGAEFDSIGRLQALLDLDYGPEIKESCHEDVLFKYAILEEKGLLYKRYPYNELKSLFSKI